MKSHLSDVIINQLVSKSRNRLHMLHLHPVLLADVLIFVNARPVVTDTIINQFIVTSLNCYVRKGSFSRKISMNMSLHEIYNYMTAQKLNF